jgi:tetratricopeptide (TPR) repeat protein
MIHAKSRRAILAIGFAAVLACATSVLAQSTTGAPQNQQQTPSTPPSSTTPQPAKPGDFSPAPVGTGTPAGAVAVTPAESAKIDPAEESAYKAFDDLKPDDEDKKAPHAGDTDRDKQVKLGEDFVAKYPLSTHDLQVYTQLVQDYYTKNQPDKMYASAKSALNLDPDDVSVLVLVGWVIPHSTSGGDPEANQRLDAAEQYEKHALDLLATLPKPANLTDEQFAQVKRQAESEAHSGLGLVYFRRQDLPNSITQLQASTASATNVDPTDYFVLGIDLMQLKRYGEAVDAFQKCASVPSGLKDNCTQRLATAKTAAAATPSTAPAPNKQ